LRLLGDSCGHPELSRRDADEALEVMTEHALAREAGVRGDLRQGEVAALQKLLRPLDAARSCFARSTRRRITYWCGGSPVARLNCRAKW